MGIRCDQLWKHGIFTWYTRGIPWDPLGSCGTGDPCPFGQSSVLLTSVFCVVFWGWVQPAPNRFCKRYLLGYMPEQSKLYLIDKELNVTVLANAARAWQISTWHVHDMYIHDISTKYVYWYTWTSQVTPFTLHMALIEYQSAIMRKESIHRLQTWVLDTVFGQ